MPQNFARRTRSFAQYTDFFSAHADRFRLPRPTDGLDTAWLCYPLTIAPDAGFVRADLQTHLDGNGVDTRTVWTGNATRQPFMAGVAYRQPDRGLPNADAIMERGVVLPMNHSLDDEDIGYVIGLVDDFLAER